MMPIWKATPRHRRRSFRRAKPEAFLGRLYASVKIAPRNIGNDFPPARLMPRWLARRLFETPLGLDLYIDCVK